MRVVQWSMGPVGILLYTLGGGVKLVHADPSHSDIPLSQQARAAFLLHGEGLSDMCSPAGDELLARRHAP